VIRIRRCAPKGLLRRSRYEVELTDPEGAAGVWRRETTTPVTLIDAHVGVAEAWALVRAADAAWKAGSDEWISLPSRS
jgi:hypothetical protein